MKESNNVIQYFNFTIEDLFPTAIRGYLSNDKVRPRPGEDTDEVAAKPNKRRLVLILTTKDGLKQKTLWEAERNNNPISKEERIALEDITLIWGKNPTTNKWCECPIFRT